MEFKGTKGNWKQRQNGYNTIKILGTKTKKVCEINCNLNNKIDLINKANAQLIATAPKMLEMLNKIFIEKCNGVNNIDYSEIENVINQATKID
jgi:hypothetical protein